MRSSARRSFRSGAPYLFPAAVALAVALLLLSQRERLASCGTSLESPETQIRRSLESQTRAHLDDVYGFRAGGTAELTPVRYRDPVISVEGERATVVAMLDAEGRVAWKDQAAALSYLGRERFHMRPCEIALWCAEGDQFDRLRGVLLVLFRRADAFAARDRAAYLRLASGRYGDGGAGRAELPGRIARELSRESGARLRILAWQIRVERESAEVGEDRELAPEGGPARRERAVYRLALEGDRWRFVGGL